MHAFTGMANHNGHHSGKDIEHGYQDLRDQRDRERGRDDFRGFERDSRTGSPRHDTSEYNDRGYGLDDSARERTIYRGQSGSQAGGRYGQSTNDAEHQGGNRGYWGDFDRGGRSGGRDMNYDTMSPHHHSERDRGPHAGKGPQGFQRSDERIKEMVHEALTDHSNVDATHVTVDVKGGEVTLTGTVEDRASKRLAEDIVERVTGVKDIHNQLRISTSTNTSHVMSDRTANERALDKDRNKPS